jgi:hypothetical protein
MKQFDTIRLAHGLETIYVISRIYAHGTKNYENGWDYLVECIAPNKIVPVILALPEEFTINDAIRAVADAFDLELLHDACNDRQSEAGATGASGVERVEDTSQIFVGNARPRVFDDQAQSTLPWPEVHPSRLLTPTRCCGPLSRR